MDTMTPMIAKIITVTVLTVGSNIQLPQILRPPADISGDISAGRFSPVATTKVKTHPSTMLLRPGSRCGRLAILRLLEQFLLLTKSANIF